MNLVNLDGETKYKHLGTTQGNHVSRLHASFGGGNTYHTSNIIIFSFFLLSFFSNIIINKKFMNCTISSRGVHSRSLERFCAKFGEAQGGTKKFGYFLP